MLVELTEDEHRVITEHRALFEALAELDYEDVVRVESYANFLVWVERREMEEDLKAIAEWEASDKVTIPFEQFVKELELQDAV